MSKKRREFPMEVRSGSVSIKIYKVENKGRPSYTVSYFADGRRKQKMFADFDKAHAEASSKAIAISRGELDVLELRSKDRSAYVHAIEALKPTGVPLELAAKEYAEALKVLNGRATVIEAVRDYAKRNQHELPSMMVPEAVAEMLMAKEAEGASKAYLKVLRVYLGQPVDGKKRRRGGPSFAEAFHCQLRSLTNSEVADFLRNMKVSARSKNNARQALGAFFKFCRERGWLARDHDGIAMLPKFKEAPGEIEVFTPKELNSFLTYSRPELIPFLTVGAFCGLRSAEIERLDWSEVHLAECFIEVKAAKAKTASRRIVPIPHNLARWLAPYAQPSGKVVPFENMSKQLGWLVRDTNAGLAKEAKKAKKDSGKVLRLRWKKNALRHSFISYRVADIQNVNQVALECGNSSSIIFRHYRELVRTEDAKVWFALAPKMSETRRIRKAKKAKTTMRAEKTGSGTAAVAFLHATGDELVSARA